MLATGATHSYFGHDDWAPFAPGLKHISDATEIRRRFLMAFERAEVVEDDAERQRLLTFVIVGGGATGVEMAGAIAEVAQRTLRHDFRHIDPRRSRIVLIEAGPRMLPAFPESLSDYAARSLQSMGVEVELGHMVTGCDARGVTLKDGRRIDAATVIWAAGVVASPAANWIDAEHDRAGRIKVNPDLSVPGRPEIFAIGDTASVIDSDGRPVPGIAPAAKQMGSYVGKVIAARVQGRAARAVRLSPCRRPRHDRAQVGGGEARRLSAHRFFRLAVLERRPHLFFDWDAQPLRGRAQLVVELPHIPARRPADRRRAALNFSDAASATVDPAGN